MSVSSEVNRIQAARDAIRAALLSWGVAQASDNLDELAAAIAAIQYRGAMEAALEEGESFIIPQGYHNGSGIITNAVQAGRQLPAVFDYNCGYWSIGQVANLVNDNGANAVNVTLTDNAVWTVTGTSLISSLTIEGDAQVVIPEGTVLSVNGVDYTGCTLTAE